MSCSPRAARSCWTDRVGETTGAVTARTAVSTLPTTPPRLTAQRMILGTFLRRTPACEWCRSRPTIGPVPRQFLETSDPPLRAELLAKRRETVSIHAAKDAAMPLLFSLGVRHRVE